MKYWEIEIDGTDRTGKDTLLQYLCYLSDYKYSINSRGILSQLVYTKKYNRDYTFDLSNFNKNKIIIWLYADEEDLKIRCKLTNEPNYDIINDTKLFNDVVNSLSNNYIIHKYNTSEITPYQIAKNIIKQINILEESNGKI